MKTLIVIAMLAAVALADVPKMSLCDPSANYEFNIDLAETHTTPAEVVKSKDCALDIIGFFNDDVQLTDLELDVYWGGTLLQKIDSPDTDFVYAYNPYTMEFTVFIPGFAMPGYYYLNAYPKGKVAGGEETVLACLKVEFNL